MRIRSHGTDVVTVAPIDAVIAAAIDVALVLVFVLIGRASHDENPVLGALVTAWPFVAALAVGWLASRAWRAPRRVVRSGIPIWLSTVIVGMLLRAVSGQGVQLSFVIVTTVVLAVFLLGWREIAGLVARRRARRKQSTEPARPSQR